ncbi:MAG: helix-turn-helix domain-containing protein [Rhodothermaceae bacterium]|nr:helix-turn-helix domain-containing protein [Rhodothermaceae bacterium]
MFTENIKFHRTNRGFSQEKLAEVADVSLRTIQRLESGDTEPRGDTVTRIAQALDISPGDLLQYKKKEDMSYIKGLQISAFSFLLFPILGVLIPFILWITKRDQIDGVEYSGKEIINFQITWNLVLFSGLLCYLIWVRYSFSFVTEVSLSISQTYMIVFYSIVGGLYLYNLVITAINVFRVWNSLPVWFKPSLKLMK